MTQNTRQLTTLESAFLDHLFDPEVRGNFRLAMDRAGYASGISKTQIVKQLRDQIIERAKDQMAGNVVSAIFAQEDVLREPAALGAKTKLSAAQDILDRAGLVKPQGDLKLEVPESGLIILPAKASRPVQQIRDDSVTIDGVSSYESMRVLNDVDS